MDADKENILNSAGSRIGARICGSKKGFIAIYTYL
jgi:hypothetical protein